MGIASLVNFIRVRFSMWSTRPVADYTCCWVTDGKDFVDIAYRYSGSAGGWTNFDCWEDYDGKIVAWIPLVEPKVPSMIPSVEPKLPLKNPRHRGKKSDPHP